MERSSETMENATRTLQTVQDVGQKFQDFNDSFEVLLNHCLTNLSTC